MQTNGMTNQQNHAFTDLLQTWSRHQDLRVAGAPIAELAASRATLDSVRLQAIRETTHRMARRAA